MKKIRSQIFNSLTQREHDCLRLLRDGFETNQVAADLGITVSTLNKHLASARKKLGVGRTAQALLKIQNQDEVAGKRGSSLFAPTEDAVEMSSIVCDFADRLQPRRTFDESWCELVAHVERLGVEFMNFSVVAEPPGSLTNGARVLHSSLDPEIMTLYESCGGAATDPTVSHVAKSTAERMFDMEYIVHGHASYATPQIKEMAYAALDGISRFLICKPERDDATGAPYAVAYGLDTAVAHDCQRHPSAVSADLQATARLFWDHLLANEQLQQFTGLSLHQRESLTFAARGFSTQETAEHMSVSTRSVEKILASARECLGARTTAAAVYRAMVYRALV